MTKIQWTDKTWNPFTGCSKVSAACDNCYAEKMALRLKQIPATAEKYKNGFTPTFHYDELHTLVNGKNHNAFLWYQWETYFIPIILI